MGKVIAVSVVVADERDLERGPRGVPNLNTNTHDYQFFIATPTGPGWTLETWYPTDAQHRQDIDLLPNLDHLVTRIATMLATQDSRANPGDPS